MGAYRCPACGHEQDRAGLCAKCWESSVTPIDPEPKEPDSNIEDKKPEWKYDQWQGSDNPPANLNTAFNSSSNTDKTNYYYQLYSEKRKRNKKIAIALIALAVILPILAGLLFLGVHIMILYTIVTGLGS